MAEQDPKPDPQDQTVEVPGDTGAHDIVDRTGEQMPRQSHDGIDDDDDHVTRRTQASEEARDRQ